LVHASESGYGRTAVVGVSEPEDAGGSNAQGDDRRVGVFVLVLVYAELGVLAGTTK
jgi:hypothetical protein